MSLGRAYHDTEANRAIRTGHTAVAALKEVLNPDIDIAPWSFASSDVERADVLLQIHRTNDYLDVLPETTDDVIGVVYCQELLAGMTMMAGQDWRNAKSHRVFGLFVSVFDHQFNSRPAIPTSGTADITSIDSEFQTRPQARCIELVTGVDESSASITGVVKDADLARCYFVRHSYEANRRVPELSLSHGSHRRKVFRVAQLIIGRVVASRNHLIHRPAIEYHHFVELSL
ncbi:hypothetical protein CDD80_543 [Ophiocordyceps camponoti-rufipedis]|uniref:Uncharacterized protein n=1 Tax=Ophiocordyceps camponoti-rufipedis TaxID=2004952 RepID=A0A2C5XP53_9HYPO|nr:hypothetical protein CDD80_543 [Ophiocordyceps camponoti-rufipedis]